MRKFDTKVQHLKYKVLREVIKKADKDEIATFTTLAGLIIVLVMVLDMVFKLFSSLKDIFSLF